MASSRKNEGRRPSHAGWTASRAACSLACVLLMGQFPGAALAALPDPDPVALNEQAIALSRLGALSEAIDVWWSILDAEGDGYKYAAVVHRNIGRNHQKLEEWPEAWYHLNRCAALDPAQGKCIQWRAEVEERLAPGHVRMLLNTDPEGCGVLPVEGGRQPMLPSPLDWWFSPGKHRVLVSEPTTGTRSLVIDVATGMTVLTLACRQPAPLLLEPPAEATWIERTTLRDWLLVGGGAAAALAGGITWWVAARRLDDLHGEFRKRYGDKSLSVPEYLDVKREWEKKLDEQVVPFERSSYVLWGVGGVAVATGIVLAAVLPSAQGEPRAMALMPLSVGGDGQGLLLEMTF